MRRLVLVVIAMVAFLSMAAPVAAARPIKESGTFEQALAFSSSCTQQGPNTSCTDAEVDYFSYPDGYTEACVWIFSYTIGRNGQFRPGAQQSGCTPGAVGDVSDDASAATLTATEVQLFDCNQRTCTPGDTVTVSASWSAVGAPMTYTRRETFSDGTCTYRQTITGVQSEATSSFSIGSATYNGDGFLVHEDYAVTARCR